MIMDSGVYKVEAGVSEVTIPHSLGVAPNVIRVDGAPGGSEIFTLDNKALLILFPMSITACEVAWTVGYEALPEMEPGIGEIEAE